jgi:hypothetical protein
MRKLLLCVTLLLLTGAHARGQEAAAPDSRGRLDGLKAEAARLLESRANIDRAWGAYLAGSHELKAEVPRLVEMLADPALGGVGWEESRVRQAALDALIRLGAEVPVETLLPLKQSSPDEVVILLARAPQQNRQALLSLFVEEAPAAHWLAAGNLLAETRAPGFAARLLGGLKIEADVYVYDREGNYGYGGNGCAGCGCGCGTFRSPDEYPPVFYYSLTTAGGRGSVVAAPGRHTVYYERSTSPPCGCGGDNGCGQSKDEYRVEYVADLLATTKEELKLEAHPFREAVCVAARQCRLALAAVRDEIVGRYAGALTRLLKAELLDPAEAAELKPDITLRLNDSRDGRSFPLPVKLKGVKVELFEINAGTPAESEEPAPDAPR